MGKSSRLSTSNYASRDFNLLLGTVWFGFFKEQNIIYKVKVTYYIQRLVWVGKEPNKEVMERGWDWPRRVNGSSAFLHPCINLDILKAENTLFSNLKGSA